MIRKIRTYLPDRKRVLHVLAGWLVLIGILLLLPGTEQSARQAEPGADVRPSATVANTPVTTTAEIQPQPTSVPPQTNTETATKAKKATPAPQPATNTSAPSTTTATPASAPTDITVSLNIDDTLHGQVTLPSTSNQCDVLTRALADGTIDSLNMRYSPQYKTNAVYAINGVGDPNSVWWTYKVNGKSPPLGCSNTKVQIGDQVKWEYVKQ